MSALQVAVKRVKMLTWVMQFAGKGAPRCSGLHMRSGAVVCCGQQQTGGLWKFLVSNA